MGKALHQKTRQELIEEVLKLKSLETFYVDLINQYKADRVFKIKTSSGAWDVRHMLPLVEFCKEYLQGADITVGYRMVKQGKLDAHVIEYKYRDTDTRVKRFTLIPLTTKNLEVAKTYKPSLSRRDKSIQRIVELELQAKLDIETVKVIPTSKISREEQISIENSDELT